MGGLMNKKEAERALLRATFDLVHVRRELSEACERPDAPDYFSPEWEVWHSLPEQVARGEAEQEVRLRVYAADERWESAADDYYEACFESVTA